jgi:hypothetical protein
MRKILTKSTKAGSGRSWFSVSEIRIDIGGRLDWALARLAMTHGHRLCEPKAKQFQGDAEPNGCLE